MASAARSSGRQSTSDPCMARPIGVRPVATMTASGMVPPRGATARSISERPDPAGRPCVASRVSAMEHRPARRRDSRGSSCSTRRGCCHIEGDYLPPPGTPAASPGRVDEQCLRCASCSKRPGVDRAERLGEPVAAARRRGPPIVATYSRTGVELRPVAPLARGAPGLAVVERQGLKATDQPVVPGGLAGLVGGSRTGGPRAVRPGLA